MGLFRIMMASLTFINLAMISVDFNAWFSEKGFTPQSVTSRYQGPLPLNFNIFGIPVYKPEINIPRINLLSSVYDDRITLLFYIGVMVVALLTALGLWTRISSILLAIGIVSLHHRNSIILHGGDTVIRIGCLYMALAPSGAVCSLDRIIGIWKGKISREPVRVSLWSQKLLRYNVALIYFTTFWHKFGFGSHWRDMTATWYPARLNEFKKFPVPGFVNELPFVYFTTATTLATELALGTLVFYRPLRKYVLLAGLLMHGFIEYSMNIPLFSFLMASTYLCFFDGEEIEAWAKKMGGRFLKLRADIFVPAGMRLKPAPAEALQAMDPMGLVSYSTGNRSEWSAESNGKAVKPFRASLLRSLGAWPIGVVPYLWKRLLSGAIEPKPEEEAPPTPRISKKVKVKR